MGVVFNTINDILIKDFKSSKITDVRAIRIDDHVYFTDGLYFYVARALKNEKWAYPISFCSWPWQEGLLKAAAKIGVIPKSELEKEINRIKQAELEISKKRAREYYEQARAKLIELGIKP